MHRAARGRKDPLDGTPLSGLTIERVEQCLWLTLDILMADLDYEGKPSSAPAIFARCIAMLLADIENGRRVRVN